VTNRHVKSGRKKKVPTVSTIVLVRPNPGAAHSGTRCLPATLTQAIAPFKTKLMTAVTTRALVTIQRRWGAGSSRHRSRRPEWWAACAGVAELWQTRGV